MEPTAKQREGPGADLTTRELRDLGCGRTLGRFTLLRRIATGGMAEVYVARSKGISGFEKKVAIKKILPQHSHNERFIDMIVDEAKITVSLTHPNIAAVYELGLDGEDNYFIVMEYVDGRPLNKLMQRVDERGLDTIPIVHAVHIMSEVSKGLDHAHKQRDQRGNPLSIVHRDVSPQNVLISYAGDVKLIDFGIARAEGRAAQTSHGVIKGKLRYLAPEIAAGDEPDLRADVYCCGIVLFEMLTGEAMFAPKSDMEAIAMASEARVRSPRSRNPKVPPDLDDICMRALRRDRNDRYQSAKDLHTELRRFLNQHYPAFVGGELGDFMQQMFAAEIIQDRKLDASAERFTERHPDLDDEDEEETEDPTTVGRSPTIRGRAGGSLHADEGSSAELRRKPYKPIVTRLVESGELRPPAAEVRLVGADGGEPMGVVLHDDRRPMIRAGTAAQAHAGTMPPKFGPAGALGSDPTGEPVVLGDAHTAFASEPGASVEPNFAAEPTRRASNPFVPSFVPHGHSVLPTIKGPAPDARFIDPSEPGDSDLGDSEPGELVDGDDTNDPPFERAGSPRHAQARTTSFRADGPDPFRASTASLPPPTRAARGPSAGSSTGSSASSGEPSVSFGSKPAWGYAAAFVGVLVLGGSLVFALSPSPAPEPQPIVIAPNNAHPKETAQREPIALAPIEVEVPKPDKAAADGAPDEERGDGADGKTDDAEPARVATDRNARREPDAPIDPSKLPKGLLVVNARPTSTVFIDGKKQGTTPVRLKLAPGKHKVTLQGPDGEMKTTVKVVAPGKTTTFVYRWPK